MKADLPEGTAYVGHVESKGNYGSFFKRWEIESLANGESATLELSVYTLVEGTPIINYVEVIEMAENDVDSTPGNGVAPDPIEDDEAVFIVQPDVIEPVGGVSADLELNIVSEAEGYEVFQDFAYQITLENNGPDDAANVTISLPFPDGMVFSDSEASVGTYGTFFQQWEIPLIESGATESLTLVLYPLEDGVTYTLYGQVTTSDQEDPDSTPNNGVAPNVNEDDEAVVMNSEAVEEGFVRRSTENIDQIAQTAKLYPNPVVQVLTLEINSSTAHSSVVRIFDIRGQEVEEIFVELYNGFNQLEVSTQTYQSGKYILTFDDQVIPFSIQR